LLTVCSDKFPGNSGCMLWRFCLVPMCQVWRSLKVLAGLVWQSFAVCLKYCSCFVLSTKRIVLRGIGARRVNVIGAVIFVMIVIIKHYIFFRDLKAK